LSRPVTSIKTHISTFTAGTVSHMPPEVLKDGILTPAVDVFSFGMLLWELISGELPFLGEPHPDWVKSVNRAIRDEFRGDNGIDSRRKQTCDPLVLSTNVRRVD